MCWQYSSGDVSAIVGDENDALACCHLLGTLSQLKKKKRIPQDHCTGTGLELLGHLASLIFFFYNFLPFTPNLILEQVDLEGRGVREHLQKEEQKWGSLWVLTNAWAHS